VAGLAGTDVAAGHAEAAGHACGVDGGGEAAGQAGVAEGGVVADGVPKG
jgi:hypothetical protein